VLRGKFLVLTPDSAELPKTLAIRGVSVIPDFDTGLDNDKASGELKELDEALKSKLVLAEKFVDKYLLKLVESKVEPANELPKEETDKRLCCL